jgi:hypothetical protein
LEEFGFDDRRSPRQTEARLDVLEDYQTVRGAQSFFLKFQDDCMNVPFATAVNAARERPELHDAA